MKPKEVITGSARIKRLLEMFTANANGKHIAAVDLHGHVKTGGEGSYWIEGFAYNGEIYLVLPCMIVKYDWAEYRSVWRHYITTGEKPTCD